MLEGLNRSMKNVHILDGDSCSGERQSGGGAGTPGWGDLQYDRGGQRALTVLTSGQCPEGVSEVASRMSQRRLIQGERTACANSPRQSMTSVLKASMSAVG